jgi:hypothetical protein
LLGRMPAEGSSRKPKTQTQSNDEWSVLGKPGVLLDAEAAKVVWCRVKGYPWWCVCAVDVLFV